MVDEARMQEMFQRLWPMLQEIEAERQQVKARMKKIIAGAFLMLILCAAVAGFYLFIAAVAIFVCTVFLYNAAGKDYVRNFKTKVMGPLVKAYDPHLEYQPQSGIYESEMMGSRIFLTHPNRYATEDLVSGAIGKTSVKFAEIRASRETGSGKNRRVEHIFNGLFFIADFNKDFKGTTLVLPDVAESTLGSFIGNMLQSSNFGRPQLVKLEDPEFEKRFVVYGDDQIEARYILSPSLMQRLLDCRKEIGKDVAFSFTKNKIYIAISGTGNLFEPPVWNGIDFRTFRRYFEDLELFAGIVDDLDLNERIWTKH